MKGAVLTALCALALTHGAVIFNENRCPSDPTAHLLIPHASCDKFYLCVGGHQIELACGNGLHFNSELRVCDFPDSAKCQNQIVEDNAKETNNGDPSQAPAICAAAGSDGVLVAHENCKRFYKCSFGLPVSMICPSVLLYDIDLERCEWPHTVECGQRIIPEDNDNVGTEWEGDGANNNDPSQAPAICAAPGSDHSYVAHEYCNMFYQCWAGAPVPLFCPAGYLFDPRKDYCDFPFSVDCAGRPIAENEAGNSPGGGNQEEDIPVGNNHDDPSQAGAICARADSSGVLVAHENCNQFYKCTFGLPVALSCPGDLLFDASKDRCEWPDTVECGNRVIPEGNDNGNGGGVWEGNGAGNSDPSQAPAICAAEGSNHIHVAHEQCDRYYQCWAGAPVALNCPAGFYFNPKKDYCDFPRNVDCGNRLVGRNHVIVEDDIPVGNDYNDPSQAPVICASEDSSGVLVAHENCNQYYICSGGAPVVQSCPNRLLFDPKTDRCEWADTVECGNRVIPEFEDDDNEGGEWEGNGGGNDDPSQAPAICAAEGSDHSYVAHERCDWFYQCWAGAPVVLECPPGFYFNPKVDYCDFPANVDCSNRIVS